MPLTSRRQFLSGLAGAGVALPIFSERAMAQLLKADAIAGDRSAQALADDESYWSTIQRAFDALLRDRTALVIAHRLSTIADADRIVVVADGRIIEQGNHTELLARGGAYADLYRARASAEPSDA